MSPRRSKSMILLISVLLAGLALISWTQTWFTVTLNDPGTGLRTLIVAGDVSAPALSALALASLAATGALAIAGPVFRKILATLHLVLGACITLSAALAIATPVSAVAAAVTAATGVAGDGPVSGLIASIDAGAWPFIALACGVLIAVSAVVAFFGSSSWPHSGRKYQPVKFEQDSTGDSAISDWDSLSGGEDPTRLESTL